MPMGHSVGETAPQVEGFWLNQYLNCKSDVHRIQTLETVMSYLASGIIHVKEGVYRYKPPLPWC